MISLAFIGEPYARQVQANPEQLSGVNVVYCGGDLGQAQSRSPHVLVLDLEHLGADPLPALERLRRTGPERIVIAYTYARRDLIAALQRPGVQLVQGPLSLSNLRALLTDLVIRDILGDPRGALRPSSAPASCPRCGAALAARTSEVP